MCMPRFALASWPVISHETVVGADSDSCSKVTVPETLESPRTTATRMARYQQPGICALRTPMALVRSHQGCAQASDICSTELRHHPLPKMDATDHPVRRLSQSRMRGRDEGYALTSLDHFGGIDGIRGF